MQINLKVKTLDAQTHEFNIDNEVTVREFKDKIAERTNISADQQRIIYCGRVLADEKQLKEYDVNGKVVHVAERPPPSQRGPSTSNSNEANNARSTVRGMRNSPLFRALDGMVVGTMAIPMNAGMNNAQMPVNPFTSSSSFCMNRITVARHMLECANNIAAYLENPERGLNNTSLDILARGRWTMESTVVEVGITAADLPQNQNIVDVVQGAVSAALRRNGNNVTVVQLPTVFGSNETGGGAGSGADAADASDVIEAITDAMDGSAGDHGPTAAVIIEDVIDADEEDGGTNASSNVAQAGSATSNSNSSTSTGGTAGNLNIADSGANNSTSTGTNTDENPSRRRTGTYVLAEVMDQMFTVQTRLNPFIHQFYNLLQYEPTFEENDTTGREDAQRLFDRVSEALHYMSHAQHAISDLMLDVSQPAPRFLTCRPILVEQSGYVSSNNYLSAAAAAAAAAASVRQQPRAQQQQPPNTTGSNSNGNNNVTVTRTTPPPSAAATVASTPTDANISASSIADSNENSGIVEDPVDEPVGAIIANPLAVNAAVNAAANAATQSNDNHQMQMARIIQAVVNSAPIDTEFHVQINAPSILSIGVPMNAAAAAQAARNAQQQRQSAVTAENENSTAAAAATSNDNGNSESNTSSTTSPSAIPANQARVNTATLPTTSTQTRSTSRPQLQIGNIPPNGWNGRFIPSNMMSSFDRFLPCNSHHIREPENGNNNGNGGTSTAATAATAAHNHNLANTVNQRTMRNITDLIQRVRPTPIVGSTMAMPRSGAAPANGGPNFFTVRNLRQFLQPSPASATASATGQPQRLSAATVGTSTAATATPPTSNNSPGTDGYRRNLRLQLLNFVTVRLFEGGPINEETIPPAINRVVRWFDEALIFLPQYEKPEYDSRDSVMNILKQTLPLFLELFKDSQNNPLLFEQRLKPICEQFIQRLFSVLHVCVGRDNAEIYWGQLMRLLLIDIRSNFSDEALHFLCVYINTTIPSNTDTSDVQQFIVQRQTPEENDKPTETFVSPPSSFHLQPMETDDVASTSDTTNSTNHLDVEVTLETEPAEPLPNVIVGSEPWHNNFPNNWLPIITRDIRTQAENPPTQAPFSDAYISGMSAKRRKMVQSSKAPTDVGSLVADSVRKAIQSVGVSTSTASNQSQTPEEITNAIANDNAVQASYTDAARTHLRERLKKEPDYKTEKYPQTAKFINK